MKKFEFPLARVLDWRRTQVQIQEGKLERLYAELRAIETSLQHMQREREQSGQALLVGGSVMGAELAALDTFKKAAAVECAKLADQAAASRKRIGAQLQVVIQKRRDVKLLDHLRARKLEAWNTELARDIDREASELHLAKFAANQRRAAS